MRTIECNKEIFNKYAYMYNVHMDTDSIGDEIRIYKNNPTKEIAKGKIEKDFELRPIFSIFKNVKGYEIYYKNTFIGILNLKNFKKSCIINKIENVKFDIYASTVNYTRLKLC